MTARIKEFIDDTLENWEFYLLYELPEYIPVSYLSAALVVALNSIMLTVMFNDRSTNLGYWYLTIPLVGLFNFISVWNTFNFFNQGKTYQLLNAAIDPKKQSLYQPVEHKVGDDQSNQPLVADKYKHYMTKVKYPVTKISPNMQKVPLERPAPIDDFDQATLPVRQDTVSFLEVLKSIYHVLKFVFLLITCSGNFAQRRQAAKYELRKPTVRPMRRPTKSMGGFREPEPMEKKEDPDKFVWEVSMWSYSDVQRTIFCYFSPLQVSIMTICGIFSLDLPFKLALLMAVLIQCLMVSFLVRKFEARELDQKLINAELHHEQWIYSDRLQNARRLAERGYFNQHPEYNVTSAIVFPTEHGVSETPPRVGILFTPPGSAPLEENAEVPHQRVSIGSVRQSPGPIQQLFMQANDDLHRSSIVQQSPEQKYLREREEEEREQRMREQERLRQAEEQREEERRRSVRQNEELVSNPNPFQKSSRRKR